VSALHETGRDIARGLVATLRPALAPGAPDRAFDIARDVAQVMGLDGLDAVLAELAGMREAARPSDIEHVAARLVRLADQAESELSTAVFVAADSELTALAQALRTTEWSGAGDSAVVIYAASDVLTDLPLDPNPDLHRARLSAPVAASLRAALEWIGADEALLIQSAVHDSALTLTCPASHAGGIGPAGAVLAAVEGSLGREDDGRWTLRVPLHVERPSFLLLRIGHIPVALPWHSVARLRMLPPGDWAQLDEPVLEPLTTLQPGEEEKPGALVALGLAHAWLVADRVVWRIATLPEEVHEQGPFAASTRVVSVENGERYWVLETPWLLRAVPPAPVPPPAPRPRHGHSPTAEAAPLAPPAELDLGSVIAVAHDEPAEEIRAEAPAPAPTAAAAATPARVASPLADAAERAIELLRAERPASAAPSPSRELPRPETNVPPPSREMSRPAMHVPPPSRDLPRPEARPATSSREMPLPRGSVPPSRELPRPQGAAPPPSHSHLTVLKHADVAPLGGAPAQAAPPAAPAIAPAPRQAPPSPAWPSPSPLPSIRASATPEGSALPARRALVADDSLVARIFLARLLERRGYVVELVGDAESMWNLLTHGPWALVCADVTMPDAHGRAHVERLLDFRAGCREPFRLIVLTRDVLEEEEAELAGAVLHLRKPFDPSALDQLLGR
jgi:CheY-like chemotaxis protein